MTKIKCHKCGKIKDISNFYKSKFKYVNHTCKYCISKYRAIHYKKNKIIIKKRVRKIQESNMRQGLCSRCGKPISFNRSMRYCSECLDKYNKKQLKRLETRRKLGLCGQCGLQLDDDSSLLCRRCLDKYNYNKSIIREYYPNITNELNEAKKYMEKLNDNKRDKATK